MRLFSVSLVAIAVTVSSTASAQVNTEPLRKRLKAVGYTLGLDGSITGRTGNTEGIQVGAGVAVGLSSEPHLFYTIATADYSRFDRTTNVSKSFAHARYNLTILDGLWGELFAQMQSDRFQRMKLRNLFGVGPRVRVLSSTDFDVYFGAAYMLERDVIDVEPGSAESRTDVYSRWSTYLTAHWNIDTRVTMATTMYVQPRVDDMSNTRLLSETLFSFKVTKVLSAALSATVRYDSAPPSGVKTTDTEVKNSLSLAF